MFPGRGETKFNILKAFLWDIILHQGKKFKSEFKRQPLYCSKEKIWRNCKKNFFSFFWTNPILRKEFSFLWLILFFLTINGILYNIYYIYSGSCIHFQGKEILVGYYYIFILGWGEIRNNLLLKGVPKEQSTAKRCSKGTIYC